MNAYLWKKCLKTTTTSILPVFMVAQKDHGNFCQSDCELKSFTLSYKTRFFIGMLRCAKLVGRSWVRTLENVKNRHILS